MPAKGTKDTYQPIRWTLERACSEWAKNPRTLAAYMKQSGMLPGEDGKFSTLQIDAAIHGDIDGEKLRKTTEEADEIAIRNATSRGLVIDVADFNHRQEPIYVEIKRIVLSLPVPDEKKDEILNALARLHLDPPEESDELESGQRQICATSTTEGSVIAD